MVVFEVGVLRVRKHRPSAGSLTRSFQSALSLTTLNLQKTSVIPLTHKTGNKNFLELLTVHFYCLLQVPWGMGTVRLLSISAVVEPFSNSDRRSPLLFSMHRNEQRALALSLFYTPSISNSYSYPFVHTPVTRTCTSVNFVRNSSLASVACKPRALVCTTCSCTIKSLVTTFGNDKSCYIK